MCRTSTLPLNPRCAKRAYDDGFRSGLWAKMLIAASGFRCGFRKASVFLTSRALHWCNCTRAMSWPAVIEGGRFGAVAYATADRITWSVDHNALHA